MPPEFPTAATRGKAATIGPQTCTVTARTTDIARKPAGVIMNTGGVATETVRDGARGMGVNGARSASSRRASGVLSGKKSGKKSDIAVRKDTGTITTGKTDTTTKGIDRPTATTSSVGQATPFTATGSPRRGYTTRLRRP